MQFYKQTTSKSCQIIALQNALSFYNMAFDFNQIERSLPKHSYGNNIFELGIYLNSIGIKTQIITNDDREIMIDDEQKLLMKEYLKFGLITHRIAIESDIGVKPVIVNVNRRQIVNESGKEPYYVVAMKLDKFYILDGKSFDNIVEYDFQRLIDATTNINEFNQRGMWLQLK